MAKQVIMLPDNCLGCMFLSRDEEGFGFYHCHHPDGSQLFITEGRHASSPPATVRPGAGHVCPLLTKPVLITGGAQSWPPDPPEPPVDIEAELNKIGKCPHCGRKI